MRSHPWTHCFPVPPEPWQRPRPAPGANCNKGWNCCTRARRLQGREGPRRPARWPFKSAPSPPPQAGRLSSPPGGQWRAPDVSPPAASRDWPARAAGAVDRPAPAGWPHSNAARARATAAGSAQSAMASQNADPAAPAARKGPEPGAGPARGSVGKRWGGPRGGAWGGARGAGGVRPV